MMNKTHFTVSAAVVALLMSTSIYAGHERHGQGGQFYDYAQVVHVEAVIRHVQVSMPREECWQEEVPVYEAGYRSATPMILGGVVGGVVGNTMGKGHGKDAATIAGMILGGAIGRDVGEQRRQPERYGSSTQTRCQQVNEVREEERIDGYDVTYRYRGEEYVTRLPHDPGKRMRVRISVEPAL